MGDQATCAVIDAPPSTEVEAVARAVENEEILRNAEAIAYAQELQIIEAKFISPEWGKVNRLEQFLEQQPQQDIPLNHIFTPGLYCRQVFMPKGTLLTTRIHLTEHPFIISAGEVSVWDAPGWTRLRAPFAGVTKPGTRRVIFVHEDCIWSTFHLNPDNLTDPDEIVRRVTYCAGKYNELGGASARKELPA